MSKHVPMSDYGIIIDGGRRRRWPAAEKMQIVARRNGVAPTLLYRWRRLMVDGGAVAVSKDGDVIPLPGRRLHAISERGNRAVRQMEDRIRELERRLRRKTLEVEILKEAGVGYMVRIRRLTDAQIHRSIPCKLHDRIVAPGQLLFKFHPAR
ncbi:transposase [Palleronia marisminoris]|uniref:IS2 repressor TnpA n=1 Tax=Palleronia marisminoris TaxID=315423 RepID=A0A1Y5TT83_9RHOB|nr:transposase [Palleronia marisminoris]SLN71903.1 IS2 repressor TnpA [Palleronia marisminoris]